MSKNDKNKIPEIPDSELPEVTQKIQATMLMDTAMQDSIFEDVGLPQNARSRTGSVHRTSAHRTTTRSNRTQSNNTSNIETSVNGREVLSITTVIQDTLLRTIDFLSPSHIFSKTQNVDTILAASEKVVKSDVAISVSEINLEKNFDKNFVSHDSFAKGGQGILATANDLPLERMVAVKTLRDDLKNDEKQRSLFLKEARVTAQLEHPAVVPIYSLQSDSDNGLHLSMKYIRGKSFKDYLNRIVQTYDEKGIAHMDEHASLWRRLDIFLQVCDALAYAHSRNVMHCDLKPENVMLGEYRATYLLDWGIARKIIDPEYNPKTYQKPKCVIGTPRFLSPEAIRGEHFDHRNDIFAMGLFLYEVVTLQEAFTGDTPTDIIRSIVSGDMPPVEHLYGCHIDTDLKKIILKAAAYDAADRYQSISDFAEDIRRYMGNYETMANPDNLFQKITRFMSRHSTGVLVVVLLAIIAFVGFSAYNLSKEIRNQGEISIRNSHIALAVKSCDDVVYNLDVMMSRYEFALHACQEQLKFIARTHSEHSSNTTMQIPLTVYPQSHLLDPRKSPRTYVMHMAYDLKCDFNGMSYITAPDTNMKTVPERCRRVELVLPQIAKMMMESRKDSKHVSFADLETRFQDMVEMGMPIIATYITFTDGLHFFYPAKVYDEDYNPRKRGWYEKRMNPVEVKDENGQIQKILPENAGWMPPYWNASRTSVILSYVMRLEDDYGKVIGTIALDVNLNNLRETVSTSIDFDEAVIERTVVTEDGNVLASNNDELQQVMEEWCHKNADGGKTAYRYPNETLLAKLKALDCGFFEMEINKRPVIVVYAQCGMSQWYYFQIIDVKKMNALGRAKIPQKNVTEVSTSDIQNKIKETKNEQ